MFFVHQASAFGDIAHDGGLDEIARPIRDAAPGDDGALFGGVGDDGLNLFVLGLVLERPEFDAFLGAVADLLGLGDGGEFIADIVVDILVHVGTLERDADLPVVPKGGVEDLRCDLLRVEIGQEEARIVAPHFQGNALEGAGRAGHHLHAGGRAAREGNLADLRMRRDLGSEIVGIRDDVQDSRRQGILDEFRQAKGGERRGGGGLHHQGVAGDQRRAQLEAE